MNTEYKYLRIADHEDFSKYEKSFKKFLENNLPDDDLNFILVKEINLVVNVSNSGEPQSVVIHEFNLTHNDPVDDTGCVYCSASVEFDEHNGIDSAYIAGFVVDNDEMLFDHGFNIACLQDCSVLECLESFQESFPQNAVVDKYYFFSEFGSWICEDNLNKADSKNYQDINCVDFPVVKARRLTNGKLEIIRYTQFEQVVV